MDLSFSKDGDEPAVLILDGERVAHDARLNIQAGTLADVLWRTMTLAREGTNAKPNTQAPVYYRDSRIGFRPPEAD